jgi:hypothetical protein
MNELGTDGEAASGLDYAATSGPGIVIISGIQLRNGTAAGGTAYRGD